MNDLAFMADTLIVEELFAEQFQISDPRYFKKNAGLAEDLGLSGLSASIKNFASSFLGQEVINRGPIGATLSLISFPVLLKMNPLLGIINGLASMWGWDLASIVDRIYNALKPKIESGQLTKEDVDAVGQQIVKGASLVSLVKEGQYAGSKSDILTRIFGNIGKEKGWQFVKALVFWTVKMALLGAGILAGANALGKLLGIKKTPIEVEQKPTEEKNTEQKLTQTESKSLRSSGRGEKYFPNDGNNIWVVPIINDSIENTLLAWTVDIYPEFLGKMDKIRQNPNFTQTVNKLETNYSASTPESLQMPTGLHSRKQTVDLFAGKI